MELVFCTNNQHKLNEVAQIIGEQISFLTLKEIDFFDEIPEPFETLEENSFTKANQVFLKTGKNCFAEDTGLFIESLNGEPGVYSARYAGEPSDSEKNIEKVLEKLKIIDNRNAYFKTVITIIIQGEIKQFSGVCEGLISQCESGDDGFGYDPIFIPNGYGKTFAELTPDEKNAISHRKQAFDQLTRYLKEVKREI
jgi:XTP/dITP diphosphohydrolase